MIDKQLEPAVFGWPLAGERAVQTLLLSMAISLKRIADACDAELAVAKRIEEDRK